MILAGLCAAQTAHAEAATQGAKGEAKVSVAVGPVDEQKRALAHGQGGKDDDSSRESDATGPHGGAAGGLRGTFGRVFTEDLQPGWFGRVEFEAFSAGAYKDAGPIGGALIGGEFWTADSASGGGLPMSVFLGFRSPILVSTLGFGANFFIVDSVDDDGGFGIYAPFGAMTFGVELGSFRLLADARAIYRWQWGAPDRGQLQFGLTFSQFFEGPLRGRAR